MTIIQLSITTYFHTKKNIIHKSSESNLKSSYNWKAVLARNICKLCNGCACIIIAVYPVGIGFTLSIIARFWLILTCLQKIPYSRLGDHSNPLNNWWECSLKRHTTLYPNASNILCLIWTHRFVIISHQTLSLILWVRNLLGWEKFYYHLLTVPDYYRRWEIISKS